MLESRPLYTVLNDPRPISSNLRKRPSGDESRASCSNVFFGAAGVLKDAVVEETGAAEDSVDGGCGVGETDVTAGVVDVVMVDVGTGSLGTLVSGALLSFERFVISSVLSLGDPSRIPATVSVTWPCLVLSSSDPVAIGGTAGEVSHEVAIEVSQLEVATSVAIAATTVA